MKRKKLNTDVVDVLDGMQPSKSELMAARRVALRHAITRMQADRSTPVQQLITPEITWRIPRPPAGVVPEGAATMAMDESLSGYGQWAMQSSLFAEGQAFLGYPYLAELSQRPEYRVISETWAQEMTRKWIKITSTGDTALDDKTDKIKDIENAFKVFNVKQHIKKCIEVDGFFGRSQLYIDLGVDTKNSAELKSTLGASTSRLMKAKVRKGMLKGFKVIEPVWTYPNSYNANDPLKEDFFKPVTWFVMGQEIHSTRLLTFIGKPMPDLLKPMYAFGGLSMSQMAKPYVDNWLRTRQSVSDGISNFSIMILLTDMQSMLNEGAATDLEARADFFNVARDNRGLMLADKNSEDLKNVSMPISGLDHLQAQSQEHMCSVSQIPLVKLTGISPSGLNASSEGEIRVFYDKVEASQESVLRGHLTTILNIIQLHLFGEIDPEISFEFEKLYSMDDSEAATTRKTECDTDIAYINSGVISPQEARVRLASDRESAYASLDTSEEALPENPNAQQQPGEETDEHGNPLAGLLGAQGGEQDAQQQAGGDDDQQAPVATAGSVSQGNAGAKMQQRPITSQPVAAHDDWNEQLHPRGQPANKGQFAKSSGGGGAAQAKKSQQLGEQLTAPHTLPDDSPLLIDSREDKSPEAQAERRSIEESVFQNAKPVVGRRPVLYVMGGGGAAGKGTLKKQLIAQGKIPAQGAVSVDPDEIKMALKRYKDIAATGDARASHVVHEDGSDLSRNILARASAGKFDVVYDATMSNFKKGLSKIQEFKNKGYDVRMFNVSMTDPEVAVERAMARFKKTGRWLDPDVLRQAHKNFAEVLGRYEHTADYFESYNSDDGFKMTSSSKTKKPSIEGMPVDADGNVVLTHYSNVGGLQQLDPVAYGSGLKGSEKKRKDADPDNWVERTYYGVAVGSEGGYKKESGLGNHVYTSKIPAHLMYDYQHDPEGLFKNTEMGHNPLSAYEKAIKDSGYQGYYVNHESLGKVAAAFYPMDAVESQQQAGDENPNHDPATGEFSSGGGSNKHVVEAAKKFAALPQDTRDNMGWNEIHSFVEKQGYGNIGHAAFTLYEASKIAPKPADKLKRVTDNNSWNLSNEFDYVANVDGTVFGVTKYEDPDAEDDDEDSFVWAFQPLDRDHAHTVETTTADKEELFAEIRKHLAKPAQDSEGNPNHDPKNGEFTTGSNAGEKEAFQERLKQLRVPPAWREVMINKAPDAPLQAIGIDAKGRRQYIYSAAHSEKAAAEKFARLAEFHAAEQHITGTAFSDMNNSKLSPQQRDTAAVLALISQTGFRLGSDADTGAAAQAYGASNLLGSHVDVHGSTLVFKFIGKKGVEQNHTINNVELAQYIGNKKRRVGEGKLFSTTDSRVREYMKSIGGDAFKVKDYRTYVGTSKALEEVSKMPVPKTQSQYKKFKNQVGDAVSSILGNSRTMALTAYINPAVFASWGFQ